MLYLWYAHNTLTPPLLAKARKGIVERLFRKPDCSYLCVKNNNINLEIFST